MEENSVNNDLIKELYSNRWKIIITTALFLVLSLVLHFITPKKYTATTIVYPASSNKIDEVVENLSFGYEIHADRTLQLLKSEPMKEQLVKEFDLVSYYELDTTTTSWYHQLNTKFEKDITFARTEHLAVMIRVTLKDPFLAAEVANKAVYFLDSIQKSIFVNSLEEFRTTLTNNIATEQEEVDNTLSEILSLAETTSTPNPISTQKLNTLKHKQATGSAQAGDAIITDVLKNGSSVEIEKLVNEYYIKLGSLNSLKVKLEKIDETINMPFPKVHVVSKAIPNEKASSPKLVWNLIFGVFIGLIISVGYVLTRAGLKNLSQSIQTK